MPQDVEAIDEGMQEIRVTIRNLASREYITAGYADVRRRADHPRDAAR